MAIFVYDQPCFLKATAMCSLLYLQPFIGPKWCEMGFEIVKNNSNLFTH